MRGAEACFKKKKQECLRKDREKGTLKKKKKKNLKMHSFKEGPTNKRSAITIFFICYELLPAYYVI